jgi:hypothetical protein
MFASTVVSTQKLASADAAVVIELHANKRMQRQQGAVRETDQRRHGQAYVHCTVLLN